MYYGDYAQIFNISNYLCEFLRKNHINKDFEMNFKTKALNKLTRLLYASLKNIKYHSKVGKVKGL